MPLPGSMLHRMQALICLSRLDREHEGFLRCRRLLGAGFFVPYWTFAGVCVKKTAMSIPDDLKFDEKGLIPAVIQDASTGEVLMVAYMNAESLKRSVESGRTWFWSRSRRKFWQKGETSGNVQRIRDILYDCDQDTLLIKVDQTGPACHTGSRSCFFRNFREKGERREP